MGNTERGRTRAGATNNAQHKEHARIHLLVSIFMMLRYWDVELLYISGLSKLLLHKMRSVAGANAHCTYL